MTKYKLTYDETRIIIMSLIELKNQLIREGRYTSGTMIVLRYCQESRLLIYTQGLLPSQTPKTGFKDGSQRLRWKVKERSPHRGADSYAIIKTVSVRHLR